jgi:hypothetical protein
MTLIWDIRKGLLTMLLMWILQFVQVLAEIKSNEKKK